MRGVKWTDEEREAVQQALGLAWWHADALLDALAPFVAAREAEAWGEGFDAGHQAARAVNPEWPEMPRNPYRGERHEEAET